MIPLVKVCVSHFDLKRAHYYCCKLHDLVTRELALRIGGTKTGLLNASMVRVSGLGVSLTLIQTDYVPE